MKDNGQTQNPTNDAADHVDYYDQWNVGAAGFGHRQQISGPSNEVRHLVDTDNPSLIP